MGFLERLSHMFARWNRLESPLSESIDPGWTLNLHWHFLREMMIGAESGIHLARQGLISVIQTHGWDQYTGALPENWEPWAGYELHFAS